MDETSQGVVDLDALSQMTARCQLGSVACSTGQLQTSATVHTVCPLVALCPRSASQFAVRIVAVVAAPPLLLVADTEECRAIWVVGAPSPHVAQPQPSLKASSSSGAHVAAVAFCSFVFFLRFNLLAVTRELSCMLPPTNGWGISRHGLYVATPCGFAE